MKWIKDPRKRNSYYEETSQKKPSSFVLKALKYAKGRNALDLGCGAGVDTKVIVKHGFNVEAVDVNSEVKKYFSEKDLEKIDLKVEAIENFKFGRYDFIYAKSSLVFLKQKDFTELLKKIKKSLNKQGTFAARIWGKKDSDYQSKRGSQFAFISAEELKKMFSNFNFIDLEEQEDDRVCADGRMKHWDFINLIIQRQ